jgi:putative glycosyltransferase
VIDAITDDLCHYRPDLMVYGFIPHAGIAAQLVGIPSVVYSPCPVYRPWMEKHFLLEVPDDLRLRIVDRLPKRLRTWMARRLSSLAMRSGFFRQPVLVRAAQERGWNNPQTDMFGMLDADIQLVNDLPIYYEGQDVGPRTRIAGPLFSKPIDVPVPLEIVHRFAGEGAPKVFVSMGSSGEKEYLLTAIEAVAGVNCRAVVVCPPHVVSLDEARLRLDEVDHVLLTDRFVPAPAVNSLADVAIIHGGQGTVQTAVYAGTPVLGTGMQWEQCSNLDRLVQRGAAIRIPRKRWQVEQIRASLKKLLSDPGYAAAARELREALINTDGYQVTGDLIWDMLSMISDTSA